MHSAHGNTAPGWRQDQEPPYFIDLGPMEGGPLVGTWQGATPRWDAGVGDTTATQRAALAALCPEALEPGQEGTLQVLRRYQWWAPG